MSTILVIGCGLMGPVIAKDLAEHKDITMVSGCDIDEKQLKICSKFVSNKKFESFKLDLTDYEVLVENMKGFDVVVNASAAQFSMNVLKAAMENSVNVVDLSGAYPLEGDLYNAVKKAGITVVPGCGVDPGLADILAGHSINFLDEIDTVYFACGGLPKNLDPPLNYKIVFGGKKMPIQPGKVPMIIEGKKVEVNRYDDVEPVNMKGFADMEAFYDGYSSSLLRLCIKKGVKTFKGKTIRYKGFVNKLKFLLDVGILNEEPVVYQGQNVIPLDFFHTVVYPQVKFDPEKGDRDVTILLVQVKGKKDDSDMCIIYEMVDFYDEEKKITSMARTTGYTAAIVARMLARGDISQKGIQWPVNIIKGELFQTLMNSLKRRGIKIKKNVLKSTEL
ncbi:MAG: saccharopine dehydrogenase C-terminal domain-containing protein [Candidatus Methanofastidiosia archaeon]